MSDWASADLDERLMAEGRMCAHRRIAAQCDTCKLAEAKAVLRAVRVCPFPTCNWLEPGSHAPDCRLAKCIEDLT